MLDVVDRGGQHALVRRRHAARHLVGRQPGVLPDHADDGDADVGKDVDRRAHRRERSDDEDRQRQHDERVRPPQSDEHESEHPAPCSLDRRDAGGAARKQQAPQPAALERPSLPHRPPASSSDSEPHTSRGASCVRYLNFVSIHFTFKFTTDALHDCANVLHDSCRERFCARRRHEAKNSIAHARIASNAMRLDKISINRTWTIC